MSDYEPIVSQWYKNLDSELLFKVNAVDEDSEIVEIQYVNGDIDELDLAEWENLEVEFAEPPEDWMDSYDYEEEEDSDYPDEDADDDYSSTDDF